MKHIYVYIHIYRYIYKHKYVYIHQYHVLKRKNNETCGEDPEDTVQAVEVCPFFLYNFRAKSLVIHKSMSLNYEPASEPLHISAKLLFVN